MEHQDGDEPVSTAAPRRAHFQQLADLVWKHAVARGWPEVTYQAAFITVAQSGTDQYRFEGNSIFWRPEWDATAGTDHGVRVRGGEEAWRVFLEVALYPDLLRADEGLQQL